MERYKKMIIRNLPLIILALIAFGMVVAVFITYSAPYPTHDTTQDRADAVAKCKSMGGVYGNNACYVNGVEQK